MSDNMIKMVDVKAFLESMGYCYQFDDFDNYKFLAQSLLDYFDLTNRARIVSGIAILNWLVESGDRADLTKIERVSALAPLEVMKMRLERYEDEQKLHQTTS